MKQRKILLTLILLIPFAMVLAQLQPGDIAIIGFNFDNPDELGFVALVDIPNGTEIKFTDNGWLAAGGFRPGEGTHTWTAPSIVTAGSVVNITTSGPAFSTDGDQIIAYQGTEASPTLIYALNSEGAGVWQAEATSAQTSALPTGLNNGLTAIALNEVDNGYYSGTTSGTKAELLAAISNPTNWTTNDGRINDSIWPSAFSVDIALPVELSSFTVELAPTGVLCKWTTESEIENLGFILERKTTVSDWHEIVSYKSDESLMGQGTVSFATDYEYLDKLVQQGNTYEYRLADVDYNGVVTYHATREVFVVNNSLLVTAFPNPFNPSTTIKYSISSDALAHIAIYDITGKLITTLVNQVQPAGWHEIQWNGTYQNGKDVPGGIYLSRVTVGNEVKTNKLILLK